jgi:hypothetical protein
VCGSEDAQLLVHGFLLVLVLVLRWPSCRGCCCWVFFACRNSLLNTLTCSAGSTHEPSLPCLACVAAQLLCSELHSRGKAWQHFDIIHGRDKQHVRSC